MLDKLIAEGCLLSIDYLCEGRYEIQKFLSIAEVNEKYVYRVRYTGSPISNENEIIDSFPFDTAEEAARAAIRRYSIINIHSQIPVFKPVKKIEQSSCIRCKWFSRSCNFCAVNPSYLGATNCPSFEVEASKTPAPRINYSNRPLAIALQKAGILL